MSPSGGGNLPNGSSGKKPDINDVNSKSNINSNNNLLQDSEFTKYIKFNRFSEPTTKSVVQLTKQVESERLLLLKICKDSLKSGSIEPNAKF